MKTSARTLALAALCGAALLSGPADAQRDSSQRPAPRPTPQAQRGETPRPAPQPERGQQDRAQQQRDQQRDQPQRAQQQQRVQSERVQAEREQAERVKTNRVQNARRMQALDAKVSDAEAARLMAEELKTHRERIGRAEALKAVATRQQDRERLTEIENLMARERARHKNMMDLGRRTIGSDRFDRIYNALMAKGGTEDAKAPSGATPTRGGQGEPAAQRTGGDATPTRSGSPTRGDN
jgi:hypothetical protein